MKSLSAAVFRMVFLVALAVVLICAAFMAWVLYDSIGIKEQRDLRNEVLLIEQSLSSVDDRASYISSLGNENLRVTWIEAEGTVLFDSRVANPTTMENHLDRPEVAAALADGSGQSSRYSNTLGEVTYYNTLRLDDGTVLRLSSSQNAVYTVLNTLVLPIILVLVAVAALAAVIAGLMSRRLVQPINNLDLDKPLENVVYSEITPLLQRISTQRANLESQVDEAAQRRREFTANVSHELKTPLTVISGYAELMKTGVAKPEDIKYFSELIYNEAGHMRELVEDILAISHLDESIANDDEPKELSEVNLVKLTQRIVQRLIPYARQGEVTIEETFQRSDIFVRGPEGVLNEIIYNLIENAIRYNHSGGSVRVLVSEDAGVVRLKVSDTGIGIAPEYQDKVFERFYCVDRSRSRDTGGTGLGLAIVKHGVQYLGAHLKLESTPGVGTTITVEFSAYVPRPCL